jgi:hypothetical protein
VERSFSPVQEQNEAGFLGPPGVVNNSGISTNKFLSLKDQHFSRKTFAHQREHGTQDQHENRRGCLAAKAGKKA